MRAIYTIRSGCNHLLDTVRIEVPDDLPDSDVEAFVLRESGYADWDQCTERLACSKRCVRAVYSSSLLEGTPATITVTGDDRPAILETLRRIIQDVENAPDGVNCIDCGEYGGRIW